MIGALVAVLLSVSVFVGWAALWVWVIAPALQRFIDRREGPDA